MHEKICCLILSKAVFTVNLLQTVQLFYFSEFSSEYFTFFSQNHDFFKKKKHPKADNYYKSFECVQYLDIFLVIFLYYFRTRLSIGKNSGGGSFSEQYASSLAHSKYRKSWGIQDSLLFF